MKSPKKSAFPRYVIGIDTETTSLDPTTGDIIDVAAIKYDTKTGQEVERFESLCKPKQNLSPEIITLTGITPEMVENELPFSEIREKLIEFLGDYQLFAHNATFDVNYLRHHGVPLPNPMWDTFPLASITWPENESYNLGVLSQQLDIKTDIEHRAAADVMMTWQLLQKIRTHLHVPKNIEGQVKIILDKAHLNEYQPLFRSKNSQPGELDRSSQERLIKTEGEITEKSATILGQAGVLENSLPEFMPRSEQQQMATIIEETIDSRDNSLIEASTGTGKTYAYLIPAIKYSATQPIIISTYTRHLQDQLLEHDVPRLLEILDQKRKVTVLKGRGQYICQKRLQAYIGRESLTGADALAILKILLWLPTHPDSDIERLNFSHQSGHVIRYTTADALSCRQHCKQGSECSYQAAKQRALLADIVIVNHALLVRSIIGEETQLRSDILMVDEAHHLPEVARQAATIDFSQERLAQLLAAYSHLASTATPQLQDHINKELQLVITSYSQLLNNITTVMREISDRGRLLLNAQTRRNTYYVRLAGQATDWLAKCKFVLGLTKKLEDHVTGDDIDVLQEARRQLEEWCTQFDRFITGSAERIQWLELPFDPTGQNPQPVVLYDTVLSVKKLLEPLFAEGKAVVLTSATLTVGNSFRYIKGRLGIEQAREVQLPSSFKYEENMLLYLVKGAPAPSAPEFDTFTGQVIEETSQLLRGRTLGLFSSQKSVQVVYKYLLNRLNKETIKLLAQGLTGGRHNILQRFRRVPESVLLGTMSFWEGVDVPGDSLSAVVIAKLPFPAPNDPIIAAVAEAEKLNAFLDLAVPQAVLKLRQGIGRLLRSPSDRGVVIIVDSRFHQYDYGEQVLNSFPPATIEVGSRQQLVSKIHDWFGEELLTQWQKK